MRNGLVFAVHGFLGRGEDFNELRDFLKPTGIELRAPSFFSLSAGAPQNTSFVDMALKEIAAIDSEFQKNGKRHQVFLGYSFGARIGLKLLAQNPSLFDKWVFASCNPGFAENEIALRNARIEADLNWADLITHERWGEFIQKWFSQEVFKESGSKERAAADYDLDKLKKALTEESLGRQQDFRRLLKENRDRVVWAVGLRDQKFLSIADDLKRDSIIQNLTLLQAGHRVHLDAPKELAETIINLN